MINLLLVALGVGMSTVLGAVLGFLFKKSAQKYSNLILGFASGVMLFAAIVGLVLESYKDAKMSGIFISVLGVVCGAYFLKVLDIITPHLHTLAKGKEEVHPKGQNSLNKVLLFVMAIAIHNLPEGIAAGVGFKADSSVGGLSIAIAIAIQNIPEGMVIIAPMLSEGIKKSRTFLIASLTGVVEIIGTFIGYFGAGISETILPFILAFAGGTMIYVISDEMIPETHLDNKESGSTFALIFGFCLMMILDFVI